MSLTYVHACPVAYLITGVKVSQLTRKLRDALLGLLFLVLFLAGSVCAVQCAVCAVQCAVCLCHFVPLKPPAKDGSVPGHAQQTGVVVAHCGSREEDPQHGLLVPGQHRRLVALQRMKGKHPASKGGQIIGCFKH
eukprot:scaffold591350_cov38-Prasinocladus_malaysianus.AAC.1